MTTFTLETTLELFTCCECGMAFAMPDLIARERKRDHASFYCPSGHAQHFPAKSDVELATEQAQKYKRLWKEEANYAAAVVAERNAAQRDLRTTKGQLT